MSSHHIVIDGQEPALIIANGEIGDRKLIDQLLEWNPFVVVLDGALKKIQNLNIKIDLVLGDFDHWKIDEIRELVQPNTEIIQIINQDKTDLEKGIEYLIENNYHAANIIGATGKRSDHYLNNISILGRYHSEIKLVMLDDYSKIYIIEKEFKKYYSKNTNISLIPLLKVDNISTKNLQWNLTDDVLEYPYKTSSSNRVKEDGIVEINYKNGILLMLECWDNE